VQVADRLRAESPLYERRRLDDDVVVNEELVPFDRISQRANGGYCATNADPATRQRAAPPIEYCSTRKLPLTSAEPVDDR
jgi:hypothetical protein